MIYFNFKELETMKGFDILLDENSNKKELDVIFKNLEHLFFKNKLNLHIKPEFELNSPEEKKDFIINFFKKETDVNSILNPDLEIEETEILVNFKINEDNRDLVAIIENSKYDNDNCFDLDNFKLTDFLSKYEIRKRYGNTFDFSNIKNIRNFFKELNSTNKENYKFKEDKNLY